MSGEGDIDNISFHLGGIHNALDTITKTLGEDRQSSAQWRTDIRRKLDEQREQVESVRSDLKMAQSDIATMKPIVTKLDQAAHMSAGAARLAVVLGKFAHIISAGIGGVIVMFLDRFFHTGRP